MATHYLDPEPFKRMRALMNTIKGSCLCGGIHYIDRSLPCFEQAPTE